MWMLRRIVFAILAVVYVVVCPLVVLYAVGYLVRPGSESHLIGTGLVAITTVPSGATVHLDGRRYTQKTPTVLRSLIPGKYNVRIGLKGHEAWSARVTVRPGRASLLERILLAPTPWPDEDLSAESYDDLTPVPREGLLLLLQGTRLGGVTVYDWRSEKGWPLAPAGSSLLDARVLSRTVVRGSPYALLRVHARDGERQLWTDLRGKKDQSLLDITPLFVQQRPQRILWDSAEKHRLFTQRGSVISRLDLASQEISPSFFEPVRGFGMHGRRLFAVREDGAVVRMDTDRRGEPDVLHEGDAISRLLAEETGRLQVFPLSDRLLVFLNEQGGLLVNRFPHLMADEGVQGIEPAARALRALVWTASRIGVLNAETESADGALRDQIPDIRWVDLGPVGIQDGFLIDQGTNALVRLKDRVVLVRLAQPGAGVSATVARIRTDTRVMYDAEAGQLFHLDAESGHLKRVQVVPRLEITQLLIPERVREAARSREEKR